MDEAKQPQTNGHMANQCTVCGSQPRGRDPVGFTHQGIEYLVCSVECVNRAPHQTGCSDQDCVRAHVYHWRQRILAMAFRGSYVCVGCGETDLAGYILWYARCHVCAGAICVSCAESAKFSPGNPCLLHRVNLGNANYEDDVHVQLCSPMCRDNLSQRADVRIEPYPYEVCENTALWLVGSHGWADRGRVTCGWCEGVDCSDPRYLVFGEIVRWYCSVGCVRHTYANLMELVGRGCFYERQVKPIADQLSGILQRDDHVMAM